MITSKERAKLMSISMTENVLEHIGKDGVTDAVLTQIDNALNANELVKIKVLPNASNTPKEIMLLLCEKLNAERVKTVGRVVIIYKKSNKEQIKHLL